ncbi:hypothetical protein [Paraburkholderia aromaticivorans]|uniref:hypothetical protein n=1 Tax=Paraburkholderia aromaticivorans TaxID=2026199 RepID=UPI0014560A96|nr:hypothetical protein [Paraburkholderia aromaticivorans]
MSTLPVFFLYNDGKNSKSERTYSGRRVIICYGDAIALLKTMIGLNAPAGGGFGLRELTLETFSSAYEVAGIQSTRQ